MLKSLNGALEYAQSRTGRMRKVIATSFLVVTYVVSMATAHLQLQGSLGWLPLTTLPTLKSVSEKQQKALRQEEEEEEEHGCPFSVRGSSNQNH